MFNCAEKAVKTPQKPVEKIILCENPKNASPTHDTVVNPLRHVGPGQTDGHNYYQNGFTIWIKQRGN